jgi:hypothetical protein
MVAKDNISYKSSKTLPIGLVSAIRNANFEQSHFVLKSISFFFFSLSELQYDFKLFYPDPLIAQTLSYFFLLALV